MKENDMKKKLYIALVNVLAKAFNIRCEVSVKEKQGKDDELWRYGDIKTYYEMYCTNAKKGKRTVSPSFGFWRGGSSMDEMYEKVLPQLLENCIWLTKTRIKKWLTI